MTPVATNRAGAAIRVVHQRRLSDRLFEYGLATNALRGTIGVRVVLPASYDEQRPTRYPVLYLLHGGLGGFRDWTDAGNVEELTRDFQAIIVMPCGGTGGWYRDWHNFGLGGPPRWETFHIDQLIDWVDDQFATRARRSGRAIAGQSMGGLGALAYAARHPERFCATASFSGALNTRFPLVRALICVSSVAHARPPFAINRLPVIGRDDWEAHNPWALAPNLRGMHIAVTTGNGRPTRFRRSGDERPVDLQEHQVRAMTRSMHRRLNQLGIEHTFRDYGNIGHTFENWKRALADELVDLREILDA